MIIVAFSTGSSTSAGDRTRIEEFVQQLDYTDAFDFLSDFYSQHAKNGVADVSEAFKSGTRYYKWIYTSC